MVAGNARLIFDETGDTDPGTEHFFQRRRRDDGQIQVRFTAASAPGTVTVKLQSRATAEAPWTTVKSFTEAELGASGGSVKEKVLLGPRMQVITSNNDDAANRTEVWIEE